MSPIACYTLHRSRHRRSVGLITRPSPFTVRPLLDCSRTARGNPGRAGSTADRPADQRAYPGGIGRYTLGMGHAGGLAKLKVMKVGFKRASGRHVRQVP